MAEQPQEGNLLPSSFCSQAHCGGKRLGGRRWPQEVWKPPTRCAHWPLCSPPVLHGGCLCSVPPMAAQRPCTAFQAPTVSTGPLCTSIPAQLANLFSESSCSLPHQPSQSLNFPKPSLFRAVPSAQTILCSADPQVFPDDLLS